MLSQKHAEKLAEQAILNNEATLSKMRESQGDSSTASSDSSTKVEPQLEILEKVTKTSIFSSKPKLSLKQVMITGASSGFGEEFAKQLAPHAEHLVLIARRKKLLKTLAKELKAQHGIKITLLSGDLTKPRFKAKIERYLRNKGANLDLLINNAGLGDYGSFESADWDKLQQIIEVNITSLLQLTHAAIPKLRANKGSIINISSLSHLIPMPDFAVYAASKAFVSSFSEALAIELEEQGINVLDVCPGPISTNFGQVALRRGNKAEIKRPSWVKISKEQMVRETLQALSKKQGKLYPGLGVKIAATVLAALPIFAIRAIVRKRPWS